MRLKICNPLLILFVLLFAAVNLLQAQTPYVSKAVKFAESIPVRDMISVKQMNKEGKVKREKNETDGEINEKNEIPLKHVDPTKPGTPDASLWSEWRANLNVPIPNIPNLPTVNFLGLSQPDNASVGIGAVLPPDPTGEVGLNHYVQAVNLTFRIWDKAGNPLVAAKRMSTLFAALGPPASTRDDGDPIVMYDQLADRWIISQFMVLFNPNPHQLIAVSKTGDPTGAYYLYDFVMPNNKFNDYPHFGVWPDGYYMTDNQFNQAGTAFQGAGAFAFDRAKMLVGDPTAGYIYFDLCNVDCNLGGLLPSDLDGLIPPPIGAPNVFAMFDANEYGGTDAVYLWDFHADFAVPANSTFIQRTGSPLAVPAFDPRTNPSGRSVIPQPGTTARLDAISDRLMYRLAYRNFGGTESLIMNHTVNAATYPTYRAGVRFYQLNRTSPAAAFTIAEAQTFDGGDAENRWMGSGAMNHQGDIALGYSVSSATVNPSIRYAAKLGTDPAGGGLAQGEQTIVAGSGSQTSTSSRWGDYSQMTVDPSDDCSFWYTQEYYSVTSGAGWQTRIAKFNPGPCTVSPRGIINGTITNCSSGLPIENAFVQIPGGFSRTTAANGTYEFILPPGSYTATVTGPPGQGYNTVTSGTLTVTNGGTVTFNTCIQGIAIIAAGASALTAENCSPANNAIDPNETVTVNLSLSNIGALNTTNLVATLQNTGGVTAAGAAQSYGVVVAGGGAVTRSFSFTAANITCGDLITATLQLQDGATNLGTITYTFVTGGTTSSVATFSYTGPPVAIPDNNTTGVDIPITVSGAGTNVSDLNFRFDPLAGCDATAANTNAAVDHTFLADLIFKLRSPSGTTVIFMNSRGGAGNNICNLLFDDDGAFPSISTLPATGGVSGNYAPENLFSAFDGQTANGVWTLNVSDNAAIDVGSVRRFSIILSSTTPVCCTNICTAPMIIPTNIGPVNNDPGICGASVTMGSNLTVTGDPAPTVTYSLTNFGATISNPYTFDAGTTTVWAKASNTCGDDIKSFTITVVDNEPPVITCPGNVTVPSDPGVCGAMVNYPAPTVTDNCGGTTAPLNISQSTNSATITPGNSIACTDGISTKEGHYLRKFDLSAMALSGPYTINKINWGVELADPADPFAGSTKISRPVVANSITTNKRSVDNSLADPGGSNIAQTITLNVYTLTGAFTFANMTLVASQPVVINAQSNTLISTSLSSPPTVPANAVLVLEIYSPDGTAAGTRFFPATNNLGQSGPSYIAAPVCGATQPTDLAGVGFPNVHLILNAEGTVAGTATLTQTVGLSSGSFFPVGTTTNTFETMDAAGNSATCSFTVTVNPGPACCTAVGGTAAGSTTFCGSGTPTITATGYSTGSSSYEWYSSTVLSDYPNGGSAISGETNPASLNAGVVSTTTYFWLRVSCPGNTSTDNSTLVTVIVNPILEALATPASQTICTGSAITPIVLSGNVPATVYNWTRDNLGVTGIAANGAGDISGLLTNTTTDPVTVTFTITPTGNGCTGDPVTATVTVNPANYFVCPGDMFETINDIICFKAVNTPNPVFCGVLTRLTWKLTGATVLSSPTSGINYLGLRNMNVGVTTVTYTAKAAGNITRTCSFKVTVIETVEPYIRCPFDVDVNTDAGKCYKTGPVNLGTPVTSDNCGVASVTNDAPTVYQKGVNLVTWTVTDKSGNTRTCIQRVTVFDVQKPTLTCPANVIAYTGPDCTATPVTLPYPTFSDNCGVVKLTWAMVGVTWGQSPNTGINYVPTMNYVTGVSTVTYTATDESGNAIACSFTVTVKDVTPPTLTCPPAQTFCKVGNNVYSVPALIQEDNCVIALTTYKITGATSRVGSGTNASGVFNMGVSTIKWTVKDVNGNSSTCSTIVTVVATSNPVCNPMPLTGPVKEGNPKFTEASVSELSITAWPNPSVDYFNLKVTSRAKEAVEIRLFDMSGKLVQFKRGAPGDIYLIGDNVVSGMYIVEVRQGSKTVRTRLVKHN